jgi:hypothetical protein
MFRLLEGFLFLPRFLWWGFVGGGPWIPDRDAAGRSLPGILIAVVFVVAVVVGFVIGFLPDCRSWFASCAGRI